MAITIPCALAAEAAEAEGWGRRLACVEPGPMFDPWVAACLLCLPALAVAERCVGGGGGGGGGQAGCGRPVRPKRFNGQGWEARGSLDDELERREASGAPAGQRPSHLAFHSAACMMRWPSEVCERNPVRSLRFCSERPCAGSRSSARLNAPQDCTAGATAAVGGRLWVRGVDTGVREAWVRGVPDRTPSAASTRHPRRCALEACSGLARRQPGRVGSQP